MTSARNTQRRGRVVIAGLEPGDDLPFTISIVSDEACPRCGASWITNDEPFGLLADGRLNYPNRVKVDNAWRCYNPDCTCAYYENGRVLENKLSPEAEEAMRARTKATVAAMLADKVWITKGNCSKPHPKDEEVPEGWHLTGTHRDD
jgi:hypothetical protein